MTTAYNKTVGTSLLAWTTVTTGNVSVGSAVDVGTKITARFAVSIGRVSATAWTPGWPLVRIDASAKASGDDAWFPALVWNPFVGASVAATTFNGAKSAGDTSIVVTSATNITAGDLLFLGHTTDSTKYELARVKGISGTTVTLDAPLAYDHDSGAAITDQAELLSADLDLSAITRIRVVVDNANGGQSVLARVILSTLDSVG
jgi:hypothetical protein